MSSLTVTPDRAEPMLVGGVERVIENAQFSIEDRFDLNLGKPVPGTFRPIAAIPVETVNSHRSELEITWWSWKVSMQQ
ncbi:hypothetical protein [Aminobacter sp. BE322]|uniref:hypothetical protein n=1 Tax=unclassified Aminobacter TaxID=2644704 RepID=UPI003D1D2D16